VGNAGHWRTCPFANLSAAMSRFESSQIFPARQKITLFIDNLPERLDGFGGAAVLAPSESRRSESSKRLLDLRPIPDWQSNADKPAAVASLASPADMGGGAGAHITGRGGERMSRQRAVVFPRQVCFHRCSILSGWIPALCVLIVASCASLERLPSVPATDTARAMPLDLTNARFFPLKQRAELIAEGEQALEEQRQALGLAPGAKLPTARFLALSGGGDDGAFGSGLLVGWTEAGDRPQFDVVTGVSTGALIAPFAFLGPRHDSQLREVFTAVDTGDILISRGFLRGIFSDALSDTTPLWNLISRYFNAPMMEAIAQEYKKGRLLLIGTTNLDAEQPTIWNLGAIAASGHPNALDLIRKILRASSAIPGIFQPVMIDVMLDGRPYQELHVDGGAIAQIFLYPPNVSVNRIVLREREAFLIRNARENSEWANVQRRTLKIGSRAILTMLRSSGANDLTRIYLVAQRDGVDYNLAYIESDFTTPHPAKTFDTTYMNALFNYAYQKSRHGYPWQKIPPVLAGLEE
jgi:predicted acylesterase/phospholipase RssA